MSRNGRTNVPAVPAAPSAGGGSVAWNVPPGDGVLLADFDLPAGTWFDWHTHDRHQLAWATHGTVVVRVGDQHWVLPPARALWLPAGTPHRTGATKNAVLRGIYADPARCPVNWSRPHMVRVRPLLSELLDHLTGTALGDDQRTRAEALVFDLLEPADVAPVALPVPSDPRARQVARLLLTNPADPRDLPALARTTGASARTLARIWTTETRMTFGQWRTHTRLRAALPLLADGHTVEAVARQVGYSSPSAFVAAFRRTVGVPPRAYVNPSR